MRILIVKTSSMGDVIHTLPALTDAGLHNQKVRFDWVVEERFAEIPRWHPLVDDVIPVALRRWRKNLLAKKTSFEWRQFYQQLTAKQYDLVIDAQGLLKSAALTRLAKGLRAGFDWQSAREPAASLFYQRKLAVAKGQHAITRVRQLFGQALGYELPAGAPNYGIDRQQLVQEASAPYLVFLHGTTWTTKHWPEQYWQQLAKIAGENNFIVKLPWGNAAELERAQRIAASCPNVMVLPQLDLIGMARVLAGTQGIVAVDTGLGHLAAALDVPTVSLYGPTNPILTGTLGQSQQHLVANFVCAPCLSRECTYRGPSPFKSDSPLYPPCFATLLPGDVWASLASLAKLPSSL
jgi:heptosyltransferase-1